MTTVDDTAFKPQPTAETNGVLRLPHLDVLESEGIHIIREVAAEFERPVLLFSGGKDSVVMLHLARKAFWPAPVPFPLMHVDTGHNFPEVMTYRDDVVERFGLRLLVMKVQDYIDDGRLREFGGEVVPGLHRLVFATGDWQAQRGRDSFYPQVVITFTVGDGHHHVPLLLSPFAYSTYRGS